MRFTAKHCLYLAISTIALTPSVLFAAVAVDARLQPVAQLMPYLQRATIKANALNAAIGSQFIEKNRSVDFNQTSHVRLKQTFGGVPVWGGEVVVHTPSTKNRTAGAALTASANGTYYNKLEQDLPAKPTAQHAERIANQAVSEARNQYSADTKLHDVQNNLIVYIRQSDNKAVWAYQVSFTLATEEGVIAQPTMIVDAYSGETYMKWDNRETASSIVSGGGIGGNVKTGKLFYDDSDAQHRGFNVTRNTSINPLSKDFKGRCYLDNESSSVSIFSLFRDIAGIPFDKSSYACVSQDPNHHNLYWDSDDQTINEDYSPYNDAMYGSELVIGFYKDWYGIAPVTLDDHTTAMKLPLVINTIPNAAWNPRKQRLELGTSTSKLFPGASGFYPFTSPGVMAHEISHAFTSQHSDLIYQGGSGAMNESFSDMADQTLKSYAYGKNDWRIGSEIVRDPAVLQCKDTSDCALRYMDTPTKDGISADNVVDGFKSTNVHYSSGVFNKMFYTLATQPNWSVRKAFAVVMNANAHYWTSGTGTNQDFKPIACGIIASVKDFHAKDSSYDVQSVITALKAVGFTDNGNSAAPNFALIDVKDCE